MLDSLPSGHPQHVNPIIGSIFQAEAEALPYDVDEERIIYRQVPVSIDTKPKINAFLQDHGRCQGKTLLVTVGIT